MARGTIEIRGADKLVGKLKRNANLGDVKNVVRLNGAELQRRMQRNANFVKGYQTGATKRSIKYTSQDRGFTAKVAPGTEYSPYLEYGTRFMDAQPFVGPSWRKQKEKFKKDMKRLMK